MSDLTSNRKPLLPRLGHWLAELVLVFVGAYAAFWLTNYQEHQSDRQRHDQILAALEAEVTREIQGSEEQVTRHREVTARFTRALAAGEMPAVRPFTFTSGYSATDTAALLQSGGYQLLDIKTIFAVRRVEEVARNGLGDINHAMKLSDELIVPNLDQDISFFYDPETKQLRKRYADYPKALEMVDQFFDDYLKALTALLDRIKAERQRR
jgi:hypothetical protein